MSDPKDIVRRGYDLVSRAYRGDEFPPEDPDVRRYAAWIEEFAALAPRGGSVLDLGCGNGLPVARLLVKHGFTVCGVDLSQVQIERARAAVPEASFLCADMSELDFPGGSFDGVVAFYSVIHLPLEEQPALFARVHRWLRPGGVFMGTVGASAWTGTEADWLGVSGGTMFWSTADEATYREWLELAGFRVHVSRFVPEGDGGHALVIANR